jgi:type II secretory pathway component PulF
MGISGFVAGYWWLLLLTLGGIVIGWQRFVVNGPGRAWWDGTQLRTPILGRLIRQLEASRFARSMGILAGGGVTITQALAVVRDTMQNHHVREAIAKLADSVQSGGTIAGPLGRSGLFPPLLVQMVRVGENTGRLDEMLLRAARVHETEAKLTLDRLVSILPVVMILMLACVIGFIVAGLVLALMEFQTTGLG